VNEAPYSASRIQYEKYSKTEKVGLKTIGDGEGNEGEMKPSVALSSKFGISKLTFIPLR